jgi:hypothetical protein
LLAEDEVRDQVATLIADAAYKSPPDHPAGRAQSILARQIRCGGGASFRVFLPDVQCLNASST